jgi:hypothetical protein
MAKSLKTITKRLLSSHKAKTTAEGKLKKNRSEFFERATEECSDESTLARKTVEIWGPPSQHQEYIEREYPGWIIIEGKELEDSTNEDEHYDVIIQENPELKPFKFVHPELGMVFERQVRQGSVMLDNERLKYEDPELYKRVTEEVRVPVDFDTLDEDTVAAVQQYVFRGKPTVALPAPRKAKEEELSGEGS